MEGKVLIIGKQYNMKKVFKVMVAIGIVLYVLLSIRNIYGSILYYNIINYNPEVYSSAFTFATSNYFRYQLWICLIPVVAFTLTGGLTYLWLCSYELTVTDKRIYGKMAWGKLVDLPIDSVSATATTRLIKGVSLLTSSGRFSLRFIKNADEIYGVINNLLIERQQKNVVATVATATPNTDEADQLKKYKDLLDTGVITQEEFEAKKKQLLGL